MLGQAKILFVHSLIILDLGPEKDPKTGRIMTLEESIKSPTLMKGENIKSKFTNDYI
jgi:hypothetical protein